MKRILTYLAVIMLCIIPSMLITQDNSSLHIQKRYGVFTTRKGFAEIGTVIEERIYFKSTLEPREVVGGNNLILVKKDSRGELMTVEGETMLFEKTTFYIDVFNNLRMVCELLHGLIEMNLSNVTENFPISIKTEAIVVKTRKNAVFRIRNDRWNYTSGVLVKSGYVWVFDRINPDECVIINENQSLILTEGQRLYDAKMPNDIEIISGCIEKFGEDELDDSEDDEDFSSEFSFDVLTNMKVKICLIIPEIILLIMKIISIIPPLITIIQMMPVIIVIIMIARTMMTMMIVQTTMMMTMMIVRTTMTMMMKTNNICFIEK